MTSVITNRDRDCVACRAVSGAGLVGIGAYLGYQSRKNKTFAGRFGLFNLAIAFSALGVARIFDLPPFRKTLEQQYDLKSYMPKA